MTLDSELRRVDIRQEERLKPSGHLAARGCSLSRRWLSSCFSTAPLRLSLAPRAFRALHRLEVLAGHQTCRHCDHATALAPTIFSSGLSSRHDGPVSFFRVRSRRNHSFRRTMRHGPLLERTSSEAMYFARDGVKRDGHVGKSKLTRAGAYGEGHLPHRVRRTAPYELLEMV